MISNQFILSIIILLFQPNFFNCFDSVRFNHQHPPYHHHHHHHYHDNNQSAVDNTTIQVPPLELFEKMNQYDDIDMLIADLVENNGQDDDKVPEFIESRFGDADANERSGNLVPTDPAVCQPERQTVRLIETDDPTIIHIPECTRIERCGGCCNNILFECQPIETETVTMKVLKTRYTGSQKLAKLEKLLIPIERHLKCRCDCRVKPEDCNQYQKYDKRQCGCVCVNFDEREKCYQNNDLKIWNNDTCTCQCRKIIQCTTGSYFDPIKCKCLKNIKQRFNGGGSGEDEPIPYEF